MHATNTNFSRNHRTITQVLTYRALGPEKGQHASWNMRFGGPLSRPPAAVQVRKVRFFGSWQLAGEVWTALRGN